MKVLLKIMLSFLVLALLIGTVGSEAYAYNYNSDVVNKGRYYCPADGEFYTVAGSHKGHVRKAHVVSRPATKVAPTPVPYRPSSVSPRIPLPYSKSGGPTFIERVGALFDIDVWVTQVPVRYIYSSYYGYGRYRYGRYGRHFGVGGHTSYRYNLYGHNIFR